MKHDPKTAIHMEKLLGLACKLGGTESLGISKAGQIVLANLMESQIWHEPISSVALHGEGLERGQWPLLTPMPDTSDSPSMPPVPFKIPPSAGVQKEWSE